MKKFSREDASGSTIARSVDPEVPTKPCPACAAHSALDFLRGAACVVVHVRRTEPLDFSTIGLCVEHGRTFVELVDELARHSLFSD